ncbi:adenylate/guanylate cyclase domain-containing protein [Iamia majanohamensis]|uniref:Adenylate/guanylate cyclase domain-containing protein n=1 Tax=Iamia majanohamensis TaxID=467976 RepID=A0AAE9YBY0_9ACTN|nr:adenylate/guanylate cyclase domain-containing protein [Iamia majanohamensis]WCO68308.1 adenylate/guanylate cyclase domain-containing protein [Iamia majanohamensis]
MICSQCRGEIPAGARFCPSCGHATSSPDDERRVVTVLFADIVGFTTLSETLDPERVKRMVDSWFERLVADITEFGGRVDKIVGDGILALFGAPVAHEDDAERAVRAALRMQQTLADMAERATAGPGPRVQMRIGVNTGEVLVGAMRADGVITAMGDVVNTASRLQTAARPGEVLVGPTTHALTLHAIASERRGLLTARGRDAPVEAWSAVRALLPPGQRPDRDQVPLVGRTRELGLIDAAVAAALGHQRAFLGVIVGDTGVGKSRLVREAAQRIGGGAEVARLEGRCVPYGEANVWWPLAEALQTLCDVEPDDELPRVRDAVWARVAAALGDDAPERELDRVTDGLLVLMGHDAALGRRDPAAAREEVVDSFATFLEGHLRRRPVVLQLSDIHWADDDLLRLVEVLLTRLARCPLVVLATARQAVREHWNPPPGRHDVLVVNLDPLDAGPAGELLVALHGGEVTPAVRADLLARSGGNPFFMEELVALMDSSEPGAGPPRLPDTLRGIVTARLDALTPGERDVLTDAAVIGRRGPVSALREMAAEMGRDVDVDEVVATLAANELLDVEDRHWEFRSEMAREVAYATLTKAVRTKRHAGIAAWLEARALDGVDLDVTASGAADRLAGLADLDDSTVNRIAHHWAAAAELTAEMGEAPRQGDRSAERAVVWLAASARRAQRRDLLPAAERAYGRALALAGPQPVARRARLLVSRSRVRSDAWDLVGAREDAEAALAGAASDGDRSIEAAAVLRLGDIDQRSGDTSAAIARLRHAADRFETEGDERGRGEALRLLGMAQMFGGHLEEAAASVDEAGAAFARAGDRSGQGWAQQNRAWVAMLAGDLDATEDCVGRAVALFAGVDDTVGRAWSMGLLAFVRFAQGRREEAETLATAILEEAQASGDRWAVAMMRGLVGSLRLWSGQVAEALEETAQASQIFRDLGDPWGLAVSLATHGRALAMSGQVDEGFAAIASSDHRHEAGERPSDVVTMATLALAVQVGEPDRAGATVEGDAPRAGGTMGQTEGDVTYALAQLQCGRVVDVPDAGDRAYGLAASALVAAAAGRADEARERADAVEGCPEATYLDRALAQVAAAMTEVGAGDLEGAVAHLDRADALVGTTDDLVGRAMVALARAVAAEVGGAASAVQDRSAAAIAVARLGLTSEGWETAFSLAAGSRPHATVD